MGPAAILHARLNELRGVGLVRNTDLLPKGHTRIETAFHYPDGSSMDLFIAHEDHLLRGVEPVELTDFGNTMSWLAQVGINPMKSSRRRKQMNDILRIYEVKEEGTAIKCRVRPDQLGEGIIRLGQACLRLADLAFTARFLPRAQFAEEIEDLLDSVGFRYEAEAPLRGDEGKIHKVDFQVHGQRIDTALMLLPAETRNPAAARIRAEHVFAVFFDLQTWKGQRVAALDDRSPIYQEPDLNRIEKVASIVPFSDRQALVEYLQAA
jgi:hypothetical protein